MTKRLLIDGRQTEETRVVLLSGTRIEDFDYETENRKQLKGNVYLARVTRVSHHCRQRLLSMGELARDSSLLVNFTQIITGFLLKTVRR